MKLNKKLTSILVTGAMIASVGGTTAMQAFAEGPVVANNLNANGRVAAITKILQTPTGTTLPEAGLTFEYTITPTAGYPADATPAAITRSVTVTNDSLKGSATDEETTMFVAATEALFDEDDFAFPHAGHYEFKVTETDDKQDGVKYDESEYTIYVNVANDTSENAKPGDLIVKSIAATDGTTTKKTVDKGDGTTEEVEVATKVNTGEFTDKDDDDVVDQFETDAGTPGETEEAKGDDLTEEKIVENMEANGVKYVNTYVKATNVTPDGKDEDGEDPDATDDNTGLYIQKNVAGDYADKTQEFTFSVKVTAPSLSDKTEYKAVIFDLDEDKPVGDEITFASGVAQEIKLTDQQRLVFKDLDIGADYEVTEAAVANYTAAVNGNATNAASGNIVDSDANQARYVNTYDDEGTTPTGILMQNAPYILVATLAAGGLVIYLAKRREEEEEA